jgi:hypothetical protein
MVPFMNLKNISLAFVVSFSFFLIMKCKCHFSILVLSLFRSRDSEVGIATSYGLDGRSGRSSSLGRVKNFLFSRSSRPALRATQPPIQWVPGALSPGVKRPGREADHSPPTSAESRKCGSIQPLPIRLHGVVLN